eukprot:gene19292-25152_t
MNRSTFKDAVTSRVASLANDIDDDDDDDKEINTFRGNIEGEEDNCEEEYNEAGDKMEPFNLRNDREIGFFDENMNFVFKKEKSDIDSWLSSMNEEEMERSIGEAAAAALKKKELVLQNEIKLSSKPTNSINELKLSLLKILLPNETISKAMRRISGKGVTNAFSLTYEAIESSLSHWEYKGLDGQIHGPYTSQQIAEWKSLGYFTGSSAVLMRRVNPNSKYENPKKRIRFESNDDLVNDLDSDEDDSNNDKNTNSNDYKNEWILSDDIDFGDYQRNDYLSIDYNDMITSKNSANTNNDNNNDNENDSDNDLDTITNRSRKRKEIVHDDDDNDD